jgi:hypothetical protein
VLLLSCVVVVLTAAGTGVAAPVEVPDVSVPQVSVPAVPLPAPPVSVPSPPPAPVVEVPAPTVPPVSVPVPAPATPSVSTTTYAAAPRQVVDAGAVVAQTAQGTSERLFGARSAGSGDRATGRRKRTLFGTRYRKPRWLVRRLRGCLDEIPAVSSRLLVMRYGVGRFDPTPAATVARRLDLTRREYDTTRRRALRRLTVVARRSGCDRERMTVAQASPGGALAVAVSWQAPAAPLGAVPSAGADGGEGDEGDGTGEALGESERGDSGQSAPAPPAAVPPLDLSDPASDLPFLLAIVAAAALFSWLLYRRARKAKNALDDPEHVARLRR